MRIKAAKPQFVSGSFGNVPCGLNGNNLKISYQNYKILQISYDHRYGFVISNEQCAQEESKNIIAHN